jgi:hypothetical protein
VRRLVVRGGERAETADGRPIEPRRMTATAIVNLLTEEARRRPDSLRANERETGLRLADIVAACRARGIPTEAWPVPTPPTEATEAGG